MTVNRKDPIEKKVVLFGDGGVGKTTLLERYIHGLFKADTLITIGVQFSVKKIKLNDRLIYLQIWDLGGEDRFRFILPAYCRGAQGGIFVFDTTSPITLFHIEDWLPVVCRPGKPFPILAIGTKSDRTDDRGIVKENEDWISRKYQLPEVIEVSSKTGENVERVFTTIAQMMSNSIHA